MDSPIGTTISDLIEELCRNGRFYAFFQAVNLLENAYAAKRKPHAGEIAAVGYEGSAEREIIRFRPEASFAFPASDIETVEHLPENEKGPQKVRITSNFMGLYGSVSPLPAFYTEVIIAADLDNHQRREFLDLFHHRLHSLFYRVWKKYRYYLHYRFGARDVFSGQMFALMGLLDDTLRPLPSSQARDKGDQAGFSSGPVSAEVRREADIYAQVNWARLLFYTGLLGMRCRSASVLESIVSHYFSGIPVRIEQCVPRWVSIEPWQLNHTGRGYCTLGSDFTIGEKVLDRAGKFRLELGPLDFRQFRDFLPDGRFYYILRALVKFLLIDQLDFEVMLILRHDEIPVWQLSGDDPCRLGWSIWPGTHADGNGVVLQAGR
ncbi:MAG: type VI secretion system baseplate subunit TssG [Gammaproteobacteria bacterium]|nr:type VI secretion system baseplate subunit TssG [Gammaproteobacteria bacterium]